MRYKVGQKVLCVNDHSNSNCSYPLMKGSIYTIHGFYLCPCGSLQVTLTEIPGATNMRCKCHLISFRRQSYYIWRFIQLEFFEAFEDASPGRKEILKELIPCIINQ